MKKIFAFLILSIALVSCYDDFIKDFNYDGVYFGYTTDVRTLVVGEGMKCKFGVILAGVNVNLRDRIVQYKLDTSLLNAANFAKLKNGSSYIGTAMASVTSLKLLPANYYTLSDNSKFIIYKGHFIGTVTLKADSANFLADPLTIIPTYAIPFQITSADADSILPLQSYEVIALHYENMLFGNYWHGGVTIRKNPSGNPIDTSTYATAINAPLNSAWILTTVSPNALVTYGYSTVVTTVPQMKLTLNGGDITISSVTGSTFTIMPNGASTFNQAKILQNRKIFLNYKYVDASGNTCYAQDTLTFRNRIRDGINEWQDENTSNYSK